MGMTQGSGMSLVGAPSTELSDRIRRGDFANKEGYVYFIQKESGGSIKIGYSKDPVRRVRTFQTANPERLLFLLVIPGGMDVERKFHHFFASVRDPQYGGKEWFLAVPELLDVIERYQSHNVMSRDGEWL